MPRKSLTEMSLDELWDLFPISLVPYRDCWISWAKDEMKYLHGVLSEFNPVISHIGSTAIGEILSKPIIDFLVELSPDVDRNLVRSKLEESGYICMSAAELRQSYNKGYTVSGYAGKVFHVHVRNDGDNNEIRFRDYLQAHPDVKREYEELKISLLEKHKKDRDAYTAGKSSFVNMIDMLAQRDGY